MKYATLKAHEAEFRVRLMCRVLDVSSGGYYAWRSRTPSEQAQTRAALDATVREEFKRRKGRAGAPRLSRHLGRGRRQVAQSLRRQGLRAKAARKFKATTNSNHSLPVAENLLQQDFTAQRPNQVWVGDITYIATDEGWLYLAAVIDLFGRQVVGWSLQPHMQTSLVKDALAMAWWRRRPAAGLIFHSDRGSQYCSGEFQAILRAWGMRSSMSRKGNCWDNAPTESFWGRLKTASVHGQKFATREQARQAVMDWMAFYNHRRLHSSLGYLSPMQFEQRWYEAQRKKAA
mgnify:CR=1 FL=1